MVAPLNRVGDTGYTQQVTQTGPIQPQSGTGTPGVDNSPPPPGPAPGTTGTTGAPPLDPPRIDQQTMLKSLEALGGKLDPKMITNIEEVMVKLQEIQESLGKQSMQTQTLGLQASSSQIRQNTQEQLKKIDEAFAKMEANKTWNTFMKVFGFIAVGLALIGAIATGGALAIAAAAIGAAVFVAQQTGLMDKMFDAMGASQEVRMGIMIGVSVALMVMGGVGAATSAGTSGALQALTAGTKIAQQVANIAPRVGQAAQFLAGMMKVGEGVTQIGSAVTGYEKEQIEADSKMLQAQNLRLKQTQDDIIDMIRQLVQHLDQTARGTTQVVKSQGEAAQGVIQRMV